MTLSASRRIHPLVAITAAVGVAFIVAPLLALLVRAPWAHIFSTLSENGAWTAFRLSLVVSLCAGALSVLLGLPIAWVLARARIRGRALIRAIVVLPIVLPPVVGGIALLSSLGRNGIVGRWLHDALGVQLPFTTAGAIVAATFVSMPLFVLAAESGLRSLDPSLEDAALASGARRRYVFRRITLPLLAPQLVAGAVLAWARALGEFGATITFAGNLAGRTQTLPLAVYTARQTDPGAAILLSMLLVILSLVVLALLRERLFVR